MGKVKRRRQRAIVYGIAAECRDKLEQISPKRVEWREAELIPTIILKRFQRIDKLLDCPVWSGFGHTVFLEAVTFVFEDVGRNVRRQHPDFVVERDLGQCAIQHIRLVEGWIST